MTDEEVRGVQERLAAPFDERAVKFRPGAVSRSGDKAVALPYVDARAVEQRLDNVVGIGNWRDQYDFLPDGTILCTLFLRVAGEWVGKQDVGKPSKQPDAGDKVKAALSDALKRAAVKWGVGRYLYRLPQTWVDYDPQKKQLKQRPALPGPTQPAKATPAAKPQPPAPAPQPAPEANGHAPADARPLLAKREAWLVGQGVCQEGELAPHVLAAIKAPAAALGKLTQEGVDAVLAASLEFGRGRFQVACDDQFLRTELDLPAGLELAGLPAGLTFHDMELAQLSKLLTALRQQEGAAVPV